MVPKRRSLGQEPLTQQLKKWRTDPQGNPELLQLTEDAIRTAGASYNFDSSAPSTINGSLTQEELIERNREFVKPGAVQQMLLGAAKASRASGETREAVDEADDGGYEMADLQDGREREDAEQEIGVDSAALEVNFNNDDDNDSTAAIAAASRMLPEVLTGAVTVEKHEVPCSLCETDNTVPDAKKTQTYSPGKLNQHLGTGYHSPKSKFLRQYKDKQKCPFGCGEEFIGENLLTHVHTMVGQSDDHLLAAARAGLFARDFGIGEGRVARTQTRIVAGQAQTSELPDAADVPLSALLPSGNIDVSGTVSARPLQRVADHPTLRLPTKARVTQTAWWKEHKTGLYGHVADTLQAQRRFIANMLDSNLRGLGFGQSDETGNTRMKSMESERRRNTIAVLRKRLVEELGWAWAEDSDSVAQPEDGDDGEEEFEGFSDVADND